MPGITIFLNCLSPKKKCTVAVCFSKEEIQLWILAASIRVKELRMLYRFVLIDGKPVFRHCPTAVVF